MNKGISFYFGYDYDINERVADIKEAGFDTIMTNADPYFNLQNGSISKQIKLFKQHGLNISSLHMQYLTADIPHFFMDDKIGKKLEKTLKKDLKIAKKYGFSCVVVHLTGEISDVGIERFKRILKLSEKLNVPLALENLNYNGHILKYFFDNFKTDCVKFCYDAGHNHCFDPEFDYLEEYGDRLICLHLHDNMGSMDEHTLNRFGNNDWGAIAKKLARCPSVSLDYELLFKTPCDLTNKEALAECFSQATELENMIEAERKLINSKKN